MPRYERPTDRPAVESVRQSQGLTNEAFVSLGTVRLLAYLTSPFHQPLLRSRGLQQSFAEVEREIIAAVEEPCHKRRSEAPPSLRW